MPNPRHVRIIRFFLCIAAALACLPFLPFHVAWLIPFAFFGAGACCGGGVSACFCGDVAATETVTVSGVTDSSCGTCNDFNKSWVLTRVGGAGSCLAQASFAAICGIYGTTASYGTHVGAGNNRRGFEFSYQWLSDEDDCGDMDNVVDLFGSPVGDDGTCDFTGSTAST